jgi:small-conductance mechanosensitive channel
MDFKIEAIEKFIFPLGLVVGAVIVGFVVEKIILYRVKLMSIKARWEGGSVILNSLKGVAFLWILLGGIYAAILNIDLISPRLYGYLRTAILVILILSATFLISRLSVGFVKLYTGRVFPSTSILTNLTKLFVFILGMLVLLQTLGVSVAPMLTALGVGGLAVALALQDTLSNLFAGLHILAAKKFKVGDFVRLDTGNEGILEDITWRNTSIRTLQNFTIIVPNSKMASAIVINFNVPQKILDMLIPVGVSYDSDLDKVERVTIDVAKQVLSSVPGGVTDPEPAIRYMAFADFSINFNVILRVKEFTDQGPVRHDFIKRLHQRYKEEGIEIPFPIRTLYMKKQD